MLKKIFAGAFGGGVCGVTLVGALRAEVLVDVDPHEALMDPSKRENKMLRRTHKSVDWNGVKITYDAFTEPQKKDPLIVYVAPPSFVASRSSFLDVAEFVSPNFVVTETPGYGANGKRGIGASEINREKLTEGIERLLEDISATYTEKEPVVVVTAGHASPYLADIHKRRPDLVSRVAMFNPTIRGPFPSAQYALNKKNKTFMAGVIATARSLAWILYQIPLFSSGMHYLANYPSNIEHQLRSHVFVEESMITPTSIALNQTFSRTGTCIGKAGFLVGKTDTEEDTFKNALDGCDKGTVLTIIGKDTPPNAQTALLIVEGAKIQIVSTKGMLRSFEEYPAQTGAILKKWLSE